MRKRFVLPILAAALLALNASSAQADSFVLTLDDGQGNVKVLSDLTVGTATEASPDQVSWSGALGAFNVTVVAVTQYPAPNGAPVLMNIGQLMVRNNGTSAGTLQATLLRTGLSAPQLGLGTDVVGIGQAGGTMGGSTASFRSYIDPNNGSLGTLVFSTNLPGGSISGTSDKVTLLSGQDFALRTVLDLTVAAGTQINASTGLQVVNATVPEPTTLLLLGPGALGLAALRRRRLSKTA